MSSRSIEDLHPLFRPKALEFMAMAKAVDLDVLVYCTMRSAAEQNELYAQGRAKPGKIVTNAKGFSSAHNYGLAFDGVPMIHGKPAWDDHEHWEMYGHIADSIGLEWAGHWPTFKEMPHVQMRGWRHIAGLQDV